MSHTNNVTPESNAFSVNYLKANNFVKRVRRDLQKNHLISLNSIQYV